MRFCDCISLSAIFLLIISCASSPPTDPNAEMPPIILAPPEESEQTVDSAESAAGEEKPVDPLVLLAEHPPVEAVRDVEFRLFPQDASIWILQNEKLTNLLPTNRTKDKAICSTDAGAVLIKAAGCDPLIVPMPAGDGYVEAKLERSDTILAEIDELPTEYQPKSVRFTPDNQFLFTAHLGDETALSQYQVDPFEWKRNLDVPDEYQGDSGFVETLILKGRNELWLSQMSRNVVHIFNLQTGRHIGVVKLSGNWPKVLLSSKDGQKVYASCWISQTVSEIDVETRKEIRSFNTSGIPRGMAFSPDGSELLVAIYSSSAVDRINLESGEKTATYDVAPGHAFAMRHIVHDRQRGEYYITAMGVGRVYRLSEEGEWLGWWPVGEKPNTCAMSPDGHFLFVSCRGPNNPDTGYLTRGYEYGKIFIIDLEAGETKNWIWGRDQPTGLDVSPNGQYLAFTDFLTHNVELYEIKE